MRLEPLARPTLRPRRARVVVALVASAAALGATAAVTTPVDAAAATTATTTATASATTTATTIKACSAPVLRGHASCFAEIATGTAGKSARVAGGAPYGYGPADLRSAYHLSATAGRGRTVAVVDAYDDPTAEHDLAVYRARYGLAACTTRNGCFRKVAMTDAKGHRPAVDAGWATETSLDLDMVSATCPACRILLVEASSDLLSDLADAVDYAATQHVAAISNSYGGPDMRQTAAYDHPGIAITAATGDRGYRVAAPASFRGVIAVGGTTLRRAHGTRRGWTEAAWRKAGSGCSKTNPKPAWQTDATHCSGKTTADVAAVADPQTGVAAYDSTPFRGFHGWGVFGGTSASAPIIAAVYAMAGPLGDYPASWTWKHSTGLNDVTGGTNGTCSTRLWCTAAKGWDGPTGLGTPNGTASF